MIIPDNVIRNRIKNVYFIWGRGKTTIANKLHEKYGYYIYSTDDSRNWHLKTAEPVYQPYMCRDFEKEYGVKSFWELPSEVIADREKHFLSEVTPMIIADLIELSKQNEVIICEGDIDYEAIIPVASHVVYLCNCGTKFDWFDRPEHVNSLNAIKKRTDITEEEKNQIISNAYESVTSDESNLPDWVVKHGVKNIVWNDEITVEQTVSDVEKYFGF